MLFTGFGVICEIRSPGVDGILYCRGEVPDEHVNDCRAIMYEGDASLDTSSPEALYKSVPAIAPTHTEIVLPVNIAKGVYQLASEAVYTALPEWDWYQIFNMCGATLPPKPPSKRELKAMRAKAWADSQRK